MDKEYNKKRINPPFWQHDYHVLKRLYKLLAQLIKENLHKNMLTVLDYGSGTSPYKELFHNYASKYLRVDIDKNVNPDYVITEDKTIPMREKFIDVIISTQVLEHVKSPDFYLKECARSLKKGGLLLLSTHGIWPYHPSPSDYHRWTKIGLISEVKNHGFNIIKVNSILGPYASCSQFELLLIAERLVGKGLLKELLLKIISIIANIYIYFEDKLSPATEKSDASLYVICAKKI